jgi:glycosyltransferase involved in cell wall biosynthesis
MTPKVSVIVPMFNSERYVNHCLISILNQTLRDIEIIVIDDCSSDDSAAIVDSLRLCDPRLTLVRHSSNIGSGGARNTGIGLAAGAYVAFVDSDDYLENEMLGTLYKCATENNCDIAACGFLILNEEQQVVYEYKPRDSIIDLQNERHNLFEVTNPAVWNKLWRKDLFTRNNVSFPNNIYFQDLATTPRLIFYSHRICVSSEPLYIYINHRNSTTNTKNYKHLSDYFSAFNVIKRFLIDNGLYSEYIGSFRKLVNTNIDYHAHAVLRNFPDDEGTTGYLADLDLYRMAYLRSVAELRVVSFDELIATITKLK